jgi:hypothetical protein
MLWVALEALLALALFVGVVAWVVAPAKQKKARDKD